MNIWKQLLKNIGNQLFYGDCSFLPNLIFDGVTGSIFKHCDLLVEPTIRLEIKTNPNG